MTDRFGLLWRPQHAADLLAHLDEIDVLEVIADDWLGRPRSEVRALRTLAAQVSVRLHGVGLGLASTEPVEQRRLDAFARLVGEVEPEAWSEHLAFVRGGGVEIGHLAAPPRRQETIDGAVANLRRAERTVGSRPLVENVATLVDPPASTMDEADWTRAILEATDCRLLLDLHNLHANVVTSGSASSARRGVAERLSTPPKGGDEFEGHSVNFGEDVASFVDGVGADRVSEVHLAGGRWIGPDDDRRLLDDHLHDVPDPVFDALRALGAASPGSLAVILERDGAWPGASSLLRELGRARSALALGRSLAEVPA